MRHASCSRPQRHSGWRLSAILLATTLPPPRSWRVLPCESGTDAYRDVKVRDVAMAECRSAHVAPAGRAHDGMVCRSTPDSRRTAIEESLTRSESATDRWRRIVDSGHPRQSHGQSACAACRPHRSCRAHSCRILSRCAVSASWARRGCGPTMTRRCNAECTNVELLCAMWRVAVNTLLYC